MNENNDKSGNKEFWGCIGAIGAALITGTIALIIALPTLLPLLRPNTNPLTVYPSPTTGIPDAPIYTPNPTLIPDMPSETNPMDSSTLMSAPTTWAGTYYQGSRSYSMTLYIENVNGRIFLGKTNWVEHSNTITTIRGEIVDTFGDFVEQSKWKYVNGFGQETSGLWLKFTLPESIQGGGIILNTIYYAHLSNNTIEGAEFLSQTSSEPVGTFKLYINP